MNLLQRIKALEKIVKEQQIIDSEDIIHEATFMGIQLHLEDPTVNGSAGGDNYTGFFRLISDDNTPNTIIVVDGSGRLGELCGIFVSGIDKIDVPKISLTITAEAYIILYATYADDKWSIKIVAEPTLPEFTADKFAALIGIVTWNDDTDKMSQIIQIWNNGIIYNNRYS